MHKVIAARINLNLTHDIDHKNRNPLDNRRKNLRSASKQQTCRNTSSTRNSSSKYLGVSWHKTTKKWQSRITINYKQIYLGLFDTEKQAALAYNKAAKKYFREFASINKV